MALSETEVFEKLCNVNASAECVQATSGWILQHQERIELFTRNWMKAYEEATDSRRIALVYVMNDVVQSAKRTKDRGVSVAFHPHFINAIVLASEAVKKPIRRILEVFRERHIFPKHVIDEMQDALAEGAGPSSNREDVDESFEVGTFLKMIATYQDQSDSIDKAHAILEEIDFDFDVKERLKDGIPQIALEVDMMIKKLKTFEDRIQNHSLKSVQLQTVINKSKEFFRAQGKDVAMVYDAYDKYAKGIAERMETLEPIVKTGLLPGQTPPRDAPSPPPNEDPFEAIIADDDMEIDDD